MAIKECTLVNVAAVARLTMGSMLRVLVALAVFSTWLVSVRTMTFDMRRVMALRSLWVSRPCLSTCILLVLWCCRSTKNSIVVFRVIGKSKNLVLTRPLRRLKLQSGLCMKRFITSIIMLTMTRWFEFYCVKEHGNSSIIVAVPSILQLRFVSVGFILVRARVLKVSMSTFNGHRVCYSIVRVYMTDKVTAHMGYGMLSWVTFLSIVEGMRMVIIVTLYYGCAVGVGMCGLLYIVCRVPETIT